MADSDYTVAVVLQASDEGMSTTLKKASTGIKEVGDKSKEAKIDMMAAVVAMEGMTSGLNQVTGGARKYSAALVQTNKISQEQGEELNKNIAYMELVTGPLETMIALQKMATIVSHSETFARLGEIQVKKSLLIVNNSLMASMAVWLVIIIAIIGVLYLLFQAWKNQEKIMAAVGRGADKAKNAIVGLGRGAKELVSVFGEMASGATQALEPLQRIVGIIPGLGGD
tara:strand:+ start:618 stop:1295 length:678 start_codon:yes stop_codon:yes gene_type:complete